MLMLLVDYDVYMFMGCMEKQAGRHAEQVNASTFRLYCEEKRNPRRETPFFFLFSQRPRSWHIQHTTLPSPVFVGNNLTFQRVAYIPRSLPRLLWQTSAEL